MIRSVIPDQVGNTHHDVGDPLPETTQQRAPVPVDPGNEETEQQAENNQPEHLAVGGRLNDIRRNHAEENTTQVGDRPVCDLCCDFVCGLLA